MYREDCKHSMLKIVTACAGDARAPLNVMQKQIINCKNAFNLFLAIIYIIYINYY